MSQHSSSNGSKHWLWLLLIPFVAVLWVPWYNSVEPQLGGFPFFYWYQLAWVLISAVLTAFVYFKTKPNNKKAGDAR